MAKKPAIPRDPIRLTDEQFRAVMEADLTLDECAMLIKRAQEGMVKAIMQERSANSTIRFAVQNAERMSPADLLQTLREALGINPETDDKGGA